MSKVEEAEDLALVKQTDTVLKEVSAEADRGTEVEMHDDRTRENRTPGFSRMRTEWHGPDKAQIDSIRAVVDGQIMRLFPDAFVLMYDLFSVVREADVDEKGEVRLDIHGLPLWRRTPDGAFIEDYSRLGIREREDFLFRITTNIFEWKQTAADLWGDAMFAKAQWEEAFADGFVNARGTRPTVDDKTNQARMHSLDQRYFAIFQTLMSRKADAVVSGMELLGQRLKDVIA